MIFGFDQESLVFQGINHNWTGLDGREACNVVQEARLHSGVPKRLGIQKGLMGQKADAWELVPFTSLEIIEVMGRGNLDGSCPEFPIHQDRIAHDGNGPVGERQLDAFAYVPVVSGIFGMNGHRGVPE